MKIINTDFDKSNILGSIQSLPDQCTHAWEEANKVVVPDEYKNITNIVFCGMGGSGLGARVIESAYGNSIKYPIVRINDYHIPGFCNNHSLVICSSYSGETEETLQNAKEAIDKKCKILVIAHGGKLIEIAKEKNLPFYQIDVQHNPSNQPRMAIGYSVIGQLTLAHKANLITISKDDIDDIVQATKEATDSFGLEAENNQIFKLAENIKSKIVIFVSASHLVGAVHTINNQMNENAKNLSFDFAIPEINHHLMEGLKNPKNNADNIHVIFVESDIYEDRIKQRFVITKDIISKNNIKYSSINCKSKNKLSEVFETIQQGEYLNYYLCYLYNQDPSPIPWVDYFKTQLGQSLGK